MNGIKIICVILTIRPHKCIKNFIWSMTEKCGRIRLIITKE